MGEFSPPPAAGPRDTLNEINLLSQKSRKFINGKSITFRTLPGTKKNQLKCMSKKSGSIKENKGSKVSSADFRPKSRSPLLQIDSQQPLDRLALINNVNRNTVRNDTENNEKTVCYNCRKMFADDHYHNHLLFGEMRCNKCAIKFADCNSFQRYLTNLQHQSECQHQYEFISKPFQYLYEEISGLLSRESSGHQVGPQIIEDLTIYVHYLRNLNAIAPWSVAIANCLEFIKDDELEDNLSVIPNQETLFKKEEVEEETLPRDQLGEGVLLEESYSLANLEETVEYHIAQTPSDRNSLMGSPHCSSRDSNMLFSNSCPRHLLDNNTFTDQANSSFPQGHSTKGQPLSKKRNSTEKDNTRKKQASAATAKGMVPEQLSESTIQDLVQTPSDDFYYISRSPIDDCPNCSSVLTPTRTSVNITTLLITSICPECDLTIYIIPNLPDSDSRIQVVTQEEQIKGKDERKDCKGKSKNRIRPKSFFAV